MPGEKELPGHLRKEAQRLGAQLDGEALRLLIDLVGPDAIALEGELDKLATYAAGEPIDAAIVEALAFRGDGVSVFALTDAVASARARGDVPRAGARVRRGGEAPRAAADDRPPDRPAAAGAPRARCRRLARPRSRAAPASTSSGPRRRWRGRDAWSERDAALAICRLADADHAMKGGRRIDPELALERALADSL